MPEDEQALKELDELSSIIEEGGEEDISKELEEIEQITGEEKEEEEEIKKEEVKEKEEEKKEEIKPPKEKEKPKLEKPHEAIKPGIGFKYASASLLVLGAIIYALAFYLRWNGWRLIANPPSAVVAFVGTLLILAGGEIYYRGKKR